MPTRPGSKPVLAVVSPFLDKRHGTERTVAEQIERLCDRYDIHVYSERVEDINLVNITFHPIPVPPGPHLFRYVWWFLANHIYRWKDRKFGGLVPAIVYSPGVNCLDANVIAVHIVFAEFWNNAGSTLALRHNPLSAWPVLLHRKMYYRMIKFLERRVYRNSAVAIAAVSEKTASAIVQYCGRTAPITVVYNGLDLERFNPARCQAMRASSRAQLNISDETFVVLLVGNDWKKKGLPSLLQAVARLENKNVALVVVGEDTTAPYREAIQRLGLGSQVSFLPLRRDVEFYYAAADAYAGPSLDDSFALPPAECMACGLAVITSRFNGGRAIMHHGEDGLVMEDPTDVATLSTWLSRLASDAVWRRQIGDAAARTAAQYTWQRNALLMNEIFETAITP